MSKAVRAQRIVTMMPDAPSIEDGVIVYEPGAPFPRITAVGAHAELKRDLKCEVEDLGDVTLAPGLINAHTHLELSHLKGRCTRGGGFEAWVGSLVPLLGTRPEPGEVEAAIQDAAAGGVAHMGDIATSRPVESAEALAACGVSHTVFAEFIGWSEGGAAHGLKTPDEAATLPDSAHGEFSVAGHALYSTSPERLAACKQWAAAQGKTYSLHLAEHEAELEVLATGQGLFAQMLKGAIIPVDFKAPGKRSVEYADELGLLDAGTLAVHCVHLTPAEIHLLAERKVHVCLCPRSNEFIGVGTAPLEALRSAGVRLCLGTDSLASNTDLDIFSEVMFLLEKSPSHIRLSEALAWATVNPARALGVERALGTLEPGKRAAWSVLPADLASIPL